MGGKRWRNDEVDYMLTHYGKESVAETCKYLNRKKDVVIHKAKALGLTDTTGKYRFRFTPNEYKVQGNIAIVKVKRNNKIYDMIIDSDDVEKILSFGRVVCTNDKHCFISKCKKMYRIHRMVTNCPDGLVVDHINGNPLDNRKSNLRIVTQGENMQNRRNVTSESGYRNVYYYQNNWKVKITSNGKQYSRTCNTKEEAIALAKEMRKRYLPYAVE